MAAHQRTHEIDVVDHEIEHDGDVRTARIERRQTIALDEAGLLDVRQRGTNRAIESLDVACLDQRARSRRDPQELVRLGQRRRDRLLDE